MDAPRSDALQGPLLRSVVQVAWPATLFQLLIFANNVIDYQWVQLLGEEAAAGQTTGWTMFWILASLGQIFSTGLTAIVARRVGEGRPEEAAHAAGHGTRGALLCGLALGLAGWFGTPALVRSTELSARASGFAVDYLRTICAGAPLLFGFYAVEGAFKGHGDMRRPLRAVATATAINMVLDPLLIHVVGLEVVGAALATVVAFGVTAALLGGVAQRWGRMRLFERGLDLRLMARVLRIGIPVSVHGIVFSAVYIVLIREVNLAGGDPATAALGLGLRVEGFGYMTAVGLATAAASIVGQNLGAGSRRRANEGAWLAVRIGVWVTGAWGLAMFLAPTPLLEWLSPGPAAAVFAEDYFRIIAVSVAFSTLEIVLEGAFSGAGDTLPAIFLGMPLTVARIPAAMFAARVLQQGVAGIFWALTWTSVIRGLLFAFWFARGRWVHGKA